MKTASAKAKGRRLQQHVAKRIQETFNLPESDVRSLPMGSQGADVWLSQRAEHVFPFSVECKNVEKLNVAQAFEQAESHNRKARDEYAPVTYPLLVHSKNRSPVLATLKLDDLLDLMARIPDGKS